MKLLYSYIKQHKKTLFLALGLGIINQAFSLADPQIFRLIMDNYVAKVGTFPPGVFLRGVILLLLASVGVALVSRIAKNFQDYFVNVTTQRVGAKMYADSVTHSFSLPYSVFEDQRSGSLLQSMEKARNDASTFVNNAVNVVFISVVGIIIVIAYGFYVYWLIGVVYLLLFPTFGLTIMYLSKRIKKAQADIVKEKVALAGSTTETLRNIELVKSLGLYEQETSRLNDVNELILQLELKKVKLLRVLSFIQGTMVNILRAGILLLMLWLVSKLTISLGEFFTLYFYSFFIFNPLSEFGNVATQYQEARASMDKLDEIMKLKPEPKTINPEIIENVKSITYSDLSFVYETGINPSVNSITIDISSGQNVAFVGPSGSGKTTLIKLLLGLYRPSKGKLLINDIDTKKIDYDKFRQKIGYVSQDTQLFAGTIRDNLLFVRPDASDEECMNALYNAEAKSILDRSGNTGLDTKIGEGGLKLSGGEKQRIAIARALLRKPEIIIFDEATSSLDSITEKSITDTIKKITSKNPSLITIMVAHRLSTISHADLIYVLEKGSLIEKGKHQELINNKELYFALWREQLG